MNIPETDSARWKQLDELLDAVLNLPSDQRSSFLDRACGGDEALRKKIDPFLELDDRPDSFFESPAFQVTNPEMGTSDVSLLLRGKPQSTPLLRSGKLIAGRYEIHSRLGKGGMGEVWHAYDVKLRLDVALKSLRLDFEGSQDPLEFLRREVRIAREVISPNVCRIFDLVSSEDGELISMEFVDGITLMEMLGQKGPLDLRDAIDIAAQFLAGLDAVHAAGLVHRDLKPENIMITRTGRVVVMDLGIAQPQAQAGGIISGTLPYMSPEQRAGEQVDARSDIFSAGVVLAEMIHTKGAQSKDTREKIWQAIRNDPIQLPESAWKEIITRAVSPEKEDRFESAFALSLALEEIAVRAERIEDRTPYPGLASYSSGNSEYFFGREQEVETIIRKLQQLHMMAIIGPSGAGKTSFLQAGLIPALPKDWRYVFLHPGGAPMINLQQSLTPILVGDEEANARISHFEEPDTAIWILNRLRQAHSEFVLIVDRFEELFTLSSRDVQSQFAELLERATLEANVRVLLVMRDDFFTLCNEYPALAPIFSEVTPMLSLNGAALRRALLQPALKCGYKFEDETLVHNILADVEKEKGALPLLAFAASLLWEKRDRATGQLTRKAYQAIGEVRGALAQHAENMMQQIGVEKEGIVREIFRNLITAQNTRVARDTDELLSVFAMEPAKMVAQQILRSFIDARLVTSFENRIEITHESLISNWPRLVKWRAQDAESAQMRDDLRQAAQLWNQKWRPKELLWTGSAFLEFQIWRERYPGGLTTLENAFAEAMSQHANRKRKQRRIVVATMFIVLLGVLTVISSFWHKATMARDDAIGQTRRLEANRLLTASSQSDGLPATKLAYALASLEYVDTPEGRRLALRALSEGPPAFIRKGTTGPETSVEFSPDGRWIVEGGAGALQLLPRDGRAPVILLSKKNAPRSTEPAFSVDGKYLISRSEQDQSIIHIWSVSQRKIVRTFHFEGATLPQVKTGKTFLLTDVPVPHQPKWSKTLIRTWRFGLEEPKVVGTLPMADVIAQDFDSEGRWIAYTKDRGIYLRSLDSSQIGPEKLVGLHGAEANDVHFHPNDNEIISSDAASEIRIWSLVPGTKNPVRVIPGIYKNGYGTKNWLDPKGSFLALRRNSEISLWDLTAPQEAKPLTFRHLEESPQSVAFDKEGRWMAIAWENNISLYPLTHAYPYVFLYPYIDGLNKDSWSFNVRFTPDGKSLLNAFSSGIRLWSMPGEKQLPARTLWKAVNGDIQPMDIDSLGRNVLAGTSGNQGVNLISITDGKALLLKSCLPATEQDSVSFSTDGKFAAAVGIHGPAETHGIQIWDLASGTCRVLEQSKGKASFAVQFSHDGSLFSGDIQGNLYHWNIKDDSAKVLGKGKGIVSKIAITNDSRYLAAVTLSTMRWADVPAVTSELVLYDLKEKKSFPITSHGNRLFSVAFDPDGTKLITGDVDGIVRVGPITGESPHLLLGHKDMIGDVVVHPDGKWIASTELFRPEVRLWPMPEGKPFFTLPYNEFLNRLRTLTNVRVVADNSSPNGYAIKYAIFPGWEKIPTW
jgi:serine/threonine protein kinase/WD40 repeat protein